MLNYNLFMWSELYFQHHYCSLQCHMIFRNHNNMPICLRDFVCACVWERECVLEVFTEDPRPEDPGPVRVRVYILNGQPGPGRVPIYYFGSRVCLTLCVIPESIGEHRTCQWSVSVGTLCVFCNLQLVKLNWKWTEMNCHINVVYEVYIALQ